MNRTEISQSWRANSTRHTAASYASSPSDSLWTGVRTSTFGLPFIGDPILEVRSEQRDQLLYGRCVSASQAPPQVVGHRVAGFRRVHHVETECVVGARW